MNIELEIITQTMTNSYTWLLGGDGGGARWGWGIIIKIKIYAPWLISLLMFIINRNKWKTKTIFMIYEMKVLFSRIVFLGLLTSP